jgi:hypothetical protein
MIFVEAPNIPKVENLPSLFLAGGLTGCPDWQSKMVEMLKELDIIIYSPRRKKYPANQPEIAKEQIIWEYEQLRKATIVSFWFCKETLCPITLYELGNFNMTKKPIVVGMDPEYSRRIDIETQTKLARPEVPFVYSLKDLAKTIIQIFRLYQ